MVKASAPGKCILFGEHAVVYGQPALACSINQRMIIELEREETFDTWRLDGRTFNPQKHPHIEYIRNQISTENGEPLHIRIRGTIPKASGLGSSAALSVALCGALQQLGGIGFGQFEGCDSSPDEPGTTTLAAVLEERTADLNIPVVKNLPVGHVCGNAALPMGQLAYLDGNLGHLSLVA